MASTRTVLKKFASHVDESMGVRAAEFQPQWSPLPSAKDIGRTPLRKFGSLKLEQIAADSRQPRAEFDSEEIERLAASIRRTGQLHPIRVRWDAAVKRWIIVSGERRYRATLAAGLDEIDCYFHEDELAESEIREQQLVENLLRQDLKPLEEARGYRALMALNGWTGKQVADSLNVSASKVSRALALLDLPQEIQSQVDSGEISRTSASELSKLKSSGTQTAVAEEAAKRGLTQRQTAKVVRQRKGKAVAKARRLSQVFIAENGIKVTVTASCKMNYHDLQQALEEALDEVQVRIDNNVQIY